MRSIFYSFFFIVSLGLYSQDIIVTDDDRVIEAKIMEISDNKIIYKRFDYTEGPTLSINIEKVKELIYSNGRREDLTVFKSETTKEGFRDADFYVKGLEDASRFYSASGPTIGSGASTVLFWPAGLVTSIVLSSAKPKPITSNSFNKEYVSNPMYHKGYIEQAHRKKKKGVWTGFGVGTAVLLIIGIAAAG